MSRETPIVFDFESYPPRGPYSRNYVTMEAALHHELAQEVNDLPGFRGWVNRVFDRLEDVYDTLRHPYLWSRTVRRVALLTVPISPVYWLLLLLSTRVGMALLEMIMRFDVWVITSFVSLDHWWNSE